MHLDKTLDLMKHVHLHSVYRYMYLIQIFLYAKKEYERNREWNTSYTNVGARDSPSKEKSCTDNKKGFDSPLLIGEHFAVRKVEMMCQLVCQSFHI